MENFHIQKYKWIDSIVLVEKIRSCSLSKEEIDTINTLRESYSFPKEVINILLELSLNINNNHLHPAIVFEIANNWEKLKIMDLPSAFVEAKNIEKFLIEKNKKKHYRCVDCNTEFTIHLCEIKYCPICASKQLLQVEQLSV